MSIQLDGKIKTNDEKILKIEIKKKKIRFSSLPYFMIIIISKLYSK